MLLAWGCLVCCSASNAGLLSASGELEYHNDVVLVPFSLTEDSNNVRVWTESYQNGSNFDPISVLWGPLGEFIAQNDDDDLINSATQTASDSGLIFSFLAAGDYTFSVLTFSNSRLGSNLTDGFAYNNAVGIEIENWIQPGGFGTPSGGLWKVGIDTGVAVPSLIPEPSAILLLLSGLCLLSLQRLKKT